MLLNKPEYVKVDDKLYKINTDFRIALECNQIAEDKTIGDYERALAVIYKLFGEDGLDCENKNRLLELGMKYISFGQELKSLKKHSHEKFEIDFIKCKGLIQSSFKYDYKYDPYELEHLHWYDFYNDLENLSTSELGSCCVLNRVIAILNRDAKTIKDSKERKKLIDAQKQLKEKYCSVEQEKQLTPEQERNGKEFLKQLGIEL